MKRLAIGLLGVILQLPMSAHQSVQESTLVSVGGRQVEVVQAGTGSPTLVLESGGGEGAAQWSGVLPELAKQTRVLAYSRAGFGRSAPSTRPGSPQSSVLELHELLQTLGETGPLVLAGHSWGGLLSRLYVSTFPTRVAGLVLIDSTHESQFARWQLLKPSFEFAPTIRASLSGSPPELRALYEQVLAVQAAQRVEGMRPLPDVPLAVITAAKPCPPSREWTCRDPEAMAIKRQLHDEWAAASTSSLRIVSARTGHDVMNDQPLLIVDAVRFVLTEVRGATR